jgi:hypothetical protein
MKRFFDLTFRPFFVLTGIGTALAGLYAFWPRLAVEKIAKISFVQDYTIILQHWGIMVGLMGVSMIVAAYRKDWRKPILIYSGFEKSFMVYLVATNISHPFSQGFWVGAGMDATVVLYTVVYFAVCGFTSFPTSEHCCLLRCMSPLLTLAVYKLLAEVILSFTRKRVRW